MTSRFEELPLTTAYGLVFAAASFHWTMPEGRWARAAALIEPDGVFASFGGTLRLADADLAETVRVVRAPFVPEDDLPSPDATAADSPMLWPGTELERSDLFTDVRQEVIERRRLLSADEYVAHLATVSAYLELPESDRDEVLRRIRDVLPERVAMHADLMLHLARRR